MINKLVDKIQKTQAPIVVGLDPMLSYIPEHILKKAYAEVYHGKKCVRVLEEGFPQIKDVQYSNYCDIGVAYDELSKTISVVSVIDNLVKGAAGQAVQNMNDYFGLDELCGLSKVPAWP